MLAMLIAVLAVSAPDVSTLPKPVLPTLITAPSRIPDEVPDTNSWERYSVTLERTLALDVTRIGALTLQFLQSQGICPAGSTVDCAYRVEYEFRRLMADDSMVGFTQHFVVVGANGARAEGFSWFDMDRFRSDYQRGALLYTKGTNGWFRNDIDGPPLEQLKDFLLLLAEQHPRQ